MHHSPSLSPLSGLIICHCLLIYISVIELQPYGEIPSAHTVHTVNLLSKNGFRAFQVTEKEMTGGRLLVRPDRVMI